MTEFTRTMMFMIFVFIMVLIGMFASGILDKSKEEMMSRAEFICWQSGKFGGFDGFEKSGNEYVFNCSDGEYVVEYSGADNSGVVKYAR